MQSGAGKEAKQGTSQAQRVIPAGMLRFTRATLLFLLPVADLALVQSPL